MSNQKIRDALALLLFVLSVVAYHLLLRRYLADVERPALFEIGFMATFCIALMCEFRGDYRRFVADSACTGLLFVSGALAAMWCRDAYLFSVEQIVDTPELVDLMGHDITAALKNRAVGYGGALAIGLLIGRLTLGSRLVRGRVISGLLGPAGLSPVCPHCGQAVYVQHRLKGHRSVP